jgi:uncharacterized protein (TIGR03437 family)
MFNMSRFRQTYAAALLGLLAGVALSAATPPTVPYRGTYALILQDPPASRVVRNGVKRDSPQVAAARDAIRQKQQSVISQAESAGFKVTGRVDTLLNAIFVHATPRDLPKLRALPGVLSVAPMRKAKPLLNTAVVLVNAPAAWNIFGGSTAAGSGQKIAIIDTGIDYTHPAFQDSSLTPPSGFPHCDILANCAYTNSKIIVARSYVSLDAGTDPATDYPDDLTPRDRVGHGTAVAMAAGGNTNTGPLATITGLAPQAFLGNYKIYGTPGINDGSSEQAIIQAFEDAYTLDGMDVANLSSGYLPISGPFDTAECGNPANEPCDPIVPVIENAIAAGMVVVVAAGNDGADGQLAGSGYPTLNTIASPAYTPDAIAVAATDNSRTFVQTVNITGPNVPANLLSISALSSTAEPIGIAGPANLIDASTVGDGYGCSAFPAGSMTGDIALIERGPDPEIGGTACGFTAKALNAQAAGAVGVVFYDYNPDNFDQISYQIFDTGAGIPAYFVDNTDGVDIKGYVDSTPGAQAALVATAEPTADSDQVLFFSSHGPVTGTNALKPDVAAPGGNIYTAAQNLDPNGELYDPTRYTLTQGTSFSSPIVAGIAAMVREENPFFTAYQVKSAIVNTATSNTTDPDFTGTAPSPVTSVGGGLVNAGNAVTSSITVEPATISFGALAQGTAVDPVAQPLVVTNHGSSSVTLALAVNRITADTSTQLTLSATSLTLAPGAAQAVNLTLSGTGPAPNLYQGGITVTGGSVPLNVPYLYLVSDGQPNDLFPVVGDGDVGFPNQPNSSGYGLFKVVDQFGVGVPNLPVMWAIEDGGSITNESTATDAEGFAGANFTLGPTANTLYNFDANVAGTTQTFSVLAVAQPTISAGGVVSAASFQLGQGIAPGSLVAVFGSGLSGDSVPASYVPLPISIGSPDTTSLSTSVGIDGTGVSVPAPLLYISPLQVNIQVPWELAGQSSVQMKVNLEYLNGLLTTVPVSTYSPSCFTANNIVIGQTYPSYGLITSSNPAVPGQTIILYCTGLGPVNNQPATGSAATDGTSTTKTTPTVTIGGQNATVSFSGLAPGLVGVNQLNVAVPANAPSGSQPLVLSIGGVAAPTVQIPVQ